MDARVAEIKARVDAGLYVIDPAQVAEAILERRTSYNKRRIISDDQRSLILALDYCCEPHGEIARAVGCHIGTVQKVIAEHIRPPVFHRSRN